MNLNKRLVLESVPCPFYRLEPKSDVHLFLFCSYAKEVWIFARLRLESLCRRSYVEGLCGDDCGWPGGEVERISTMLWEIWRARCQSVFERKGKTTSVIVQEVMLL